MSVKFISKPNLPPPTVVSLDRDKLTFCDNVSATVQTFPYPKGSVLDMEIVNHELLVTELKSFLVNHKISPTKLVFVLSPSIYFEKDLTKFNDSERTSEAHKFLDMIPFGSVGSKTFHLGNDFKLVAINRDFYESVKNAFEFSGFVVSAVVPNFVLSTLGVKEDFNIEACRLILRRMDFVMENSFLTQDESEATLAVSRHFISRHQGLFAALSLIFVCMALFTAFYTLRRPQPPKIVSAYTNSVVTTPIPVTATPTPVATPAASLSVNILNASKVVGLAADIKTEMEEIGFVDITTGTASVSATNTLVVYSPQVPHPLRDQIGDMLKQFFDVVSAVENTSTQFDVSITAGAPK